MQELSEKVIEKFWENVQKTATCWNWIGFLGKTGLPVIRTVEPRDDGANHLVEFSPRRVSLELAGKTILPSDRAQPLVCQNKLCVNPAHLVCGDEARFWAKVQRLGNDDCWIWTAGQDKDMYGKFRICEDGKKIDIRAHQYSWQLYTGRPVPKGIQVCHKCDHPYCVNPVHLFLGTVQDNTQDRDEKGRQCKGEDHHKAKLTEEKVKEIRKMFATGNYTKQYLADLFGIKRSAMSRMLLGKGWKHVE